jgi:molecular chaperone DnaK (HSP70)
VEGSIAPLTELSPAELENAIAAIDPPEADAAAAVATWCLGIDVGTTEITAVLLQVQTGQTYPIVWQEVEAPDQPALAGLPAIVYLSAQQFKHLPEVPNALGYQALESALTAANQPDTGLLLSNFKPYLKAGTPYLSEQQHWEPVLQWSDQQPLSLQWLQQALVALLQTLKGRTLGLISTAPAMTQEAFQAAIEHITSVIIGCPTGWSDTYCFNLREAVLATGLVDRAEQIYFLEEAIAALLATLPQPAVQRPSSVASSAVTDSRSDSSLQGSTLVLSAGATTTELLLVDLPRDLAVEQSDRTFLTREGLYLRSLAYAGDAIDQDIICQILYPSAWSWGSLDLQSLDLPLPGEPDQNARDRLQQRLRNSDLGQQLLNAARQLKLALQQQDTATFKLNDQQWTVSQQDLHSRVTMPYLQQLNRELNVLLNQSGIAVQAVQQVICTGRTMALPAIAHWLKQKLPNTRVLQDDELSGMVSNRIAVGLATLPLYPQMLDAVRHQYSDYFLLHELVRLLPDESLSVGRILQLLEKQGINTNFCQRPILRLLEGRLPEGLLPSNTAAMLTLESQQNPDYQALMAQPLFSREGNQLYGFKPELRDRLQQYLTAILANTHQTLAEPLLIELGAEVRNEGYNVLPM